MTEFLDKNYNHTESSSDSEPEEKPPIFRDIASAVDIIRRGLETTRQNISEKRSFQQSKIIYELMKKQTIIEIFFSKK